MIQEAIEAAREAMPVWMGSLILLIQAWKGISKTGKALWDFGKKHAKRWKIGTDVEEGRAEVQYARRDNGRAVLDLNNPDRS